jgi:hypothetical protein
LLSSSFYCLLDTHLFRQAEQSCVYFIEAGTSTRSTTAVKDDQELLAKVGQLLENQLRIWRDFAQLVRKNPDSISKVQEDLIKRIKVGAGT